MEKLLESTSNTRWPRQRCWASRSSGSLSLWYTSRVSVWITAAGSRMRAWQYPEALKASLPISRTQSQETLPAAIAHAQEAGGYTAGPGESSPTYQSTIVGPSPTWTQDRTFPGTRFWKLDPGAVVLQAFRLQPQAQRQTEL